MNSSLFRIRLIVVMLATVAVSLFEYKVPAYAKAYYYGDSCDIASCNHPRARNSQYCSDHTCKSKDCYETSYVYGHTSYYCPKHKEEDNQRYRVRVNTSRDIPECFIRNCKGVPERGHAFCAKHECIAENCLEKATTSNGYCAMHENKDSKKSSTYKKTYSSKNKYSMPDCDDYDSFDDFMDDWDGRMPDGSDAEDYWENW